MELERYIYKRSAYRKIEKNREGFVIQQTTLMEVFVSDGSVSCKVGVIVNR